MMRSTASALVLAATLSGCGSTRGPAQPVNFHLGGLIAGNGDSIPTVLVPPVVDDAAQGQRNVVLNAMLAGKLAFEHGLFKEARASLVEAYERIETIYSDSAAARKARSTFVPEANKDFKGEPYERAMVGLYLGLTELVLGDLDNARATFKWGEYQDTMSSAETYRADMALHMLLVGWVDQCKGRRQAASESYEIANKARPALTAPAPEHTLMVLVESGAAPKKLAAGKFGEELKFARGAAPSRVRPSVQLGAQQVDAVLAEDVYFQASTLGGREVDKILAGKAAFKETAGNVEVAGKVMTVVGLDVAVAGVNSGDRYLANAGQVMAGVGLLADLVAGAAKRAAQAQADTRVWSNLPGEIFVATAPYRAADSVALKLAGDGPTAAPRQLTVYPLPGTECRLAWASAQGRSHPAAGSAAPTTTLASLKPSAQVRVAAEAPPPTSRVRGSF